MERFGSIWCSVTFWSDAIAWVILPFFPSMVAKGSAGISSGNQLDVRSVGLDQTGPPGPPRISLYFASADLHQFAVCICVKSWPEAAGQEAKRLLCSFSLGLTCARGLLTRPMAGSQCSLACCLMPDHAKQSST